MNKVIMAGRLTKDTELVTSENGTDYLHNLIAMNGYKKDDTTFMNFVAFGKTAELINSYLDKGSQCIIEGRLSVNDKGYTNVIADRVEFIGGSSKKGDTVDATEDDDEYETVEVDEDDEDWEA